MLGIVKAIGATVRTALRKPATVQYPTEKKDLPHRSRGFPVLLWDEKASEPFCTGCQVCVEVCNFDAIVMNNTWKGVELSRYDRQDLVMDLPALLQQHKSGELSDPFREPMGV